jgi:hypothetical protein
MDIVFEAKDVKAVRRIADQVLLVQVDGVTRYYTVAGNLCLLEDRLVVGFFSSLSEPNFTRPISPG